jgi:hypothetical protein
MCKEMPVILVNKKSGGGEAQWVTDPQKPSILELAKQI